MLAKSSFLFSSRSDSTVFRLWIWVSFLSAFSFYSTSFSLKIWFIIIVKTVRPVRMTKRYLLPPSE